MTKHESISDFYYSEKWGSRNSAFRISLRNDLVALCTSKNLEMTTDFLDLKKRPQLQNQYISISHCQTIGGFVITSKPVGLDIEEASRLNSKLISRISNAEEILNWTSTEQTIESIWTAKEASFKCFSSSVSTSEIQTLSQIRLSPINGNQFSAIFSNTELEGFTNHWNNYQIAICFIKSFNA